MKKILFVLTLTCLVLTSCGKALRSAGKLFRSSGKWVKREQRFNRMNSNKFKTATQRDYREYYIHFDSESDPEEKEW